MEEKELISLIEKYLCGTASAKERQDILAWYHKTDHSRIEIPLESSNEKEEIRNRMLYKLQQYMAETHQVHKMTWLRWAAAAVILLFIGSGSYFWMHANSIKMKNAEATSSSLKNDLPPGGNKAVLTLANGTKIILDSVHNGQLAMQGKSKIMKVDSGLLSYSSQFSTHNTTSATLQYNTLATPRGGQYQLILPDGSKVWLNAASSITYPTAFIGNDRKVKITGEAYFEITHDANKPFKVEVGGEEIKVLGTSFDVNAYSDEPLMKTTLITGAINVSGIILKPGQQECVDKQTNQTTVKEANTDNTIAWVHGQLSLGGDDLPTLMRVISRWYNVDVQFEGKTPKCNFVGRIDRDVYLSNILNALTAYGIRTKVEGKTVIVLGE